MYTLPYDLIDTAVHTWQFCRNTDGDCCSGSPYLRPMRQLKSLVTQTAIYGMSTILVRVLNYLLAPLHTRVFTDQADYGIISEMYAYVTFINVICMFGMETAFFRFAAKSEGHPIARVFGSAQVFLFFTTAVITGALLFNASDIASGLGYAGKSSYVMYFALIIAFDTLVNIPFARLRLEGRPWRYFFIKLTNIGINILCNAFFLLPALLKKPDMFSAIGFTYQPEHGIAYVFIANVIASAVTFCLFLPSMVRLSFDRQIFTQMLRYGAPLIIIGLAGMINETLDRVLIKYWGSGSVTENLKQVGIYSAVYKLAIFMTLAVQGFRMGAEPFFFSQSTDKNAPSLYAIIMKYFVIVCCIIFLGVGLFPDIFKIIIGEEYHSGLGIVPVLLLAQLFLGIYYNQSVWYKLTDKTTFATLIPISGAVITLGLNYLLIPAYGYAGAAWATCACYFGMVVMSYYIGQHHYHVPYPMRKILSYLVMAIVLCLVGLQIAHSLTNFWMSFSVRIVLLFLFIGFAWWLDIGKLWSSRSKPVARS